MSISRKGRQMNVIDKIQKDQMDKIIAERSIPDFSAGDTIKVDVKIVEGDKERIQAFEGLCIARSGGGLNESFTVRKISYGEGVERIFPIFPFSDLDKTHAFGVLVMCLFR